MRAHHESITASSVLNAQTNRKGLCGPSQLTSEKLKILISTPVISMVRRFRITAAFRRRNSFMDPRPIGADLPSWSSQSHSAAAAAELVRSAGLSANNSKRLLFRSCSPITPLTCRTLSIAVIVRIDPRRRCYEVTQLAQIFALIGLDEDLILFIQSIERL